MATRCFSGPRRAITSSSDLTAAKRDRTTYENLRQAAASVSSAKPSPILGLSLGKCRKSGSSSAHLRSAHSYALLESVRRGKAFANPFLEGAGPKALDESWGAGLQVQLYGPTGSPAPVTSFTGLPATCDPQECPWIGLTSGGYQIDVSSNYAYQCLPAPGSKRTSPWQSRAKVGFTSSPAYWAAVNAQPLQGIRRHSPLVIGNQAPASKFAPVTPSNECGASLPVKCTYAAFCAGRGGIN